VVGLVVTFQNNRLGRVVADGLILRARRRSADDRQAGSTPKRAWLPDIQIRRRLEHGELLEYDVDAAQSAENSSVEVRSP
jgi:hypothetical protein